MCSKSENFSAGQQEHWSQQPCLEGRVPQGRVFRRSPPCGRLHPPQVCSPPLPLPLSLVGARGADNSLSGLGANKWAGCPRSQVPLSPHKLLNCSANFFGHFKKREMTLGFQLLYVKPGMGFRKDSLGRKIFQSLRLSIEV